MSFRKFFNDQWNKYREDPIENSYCSVLGCKKVEFYQLHGRCEPMKILLAVAEDDIKCGKKEDVTIEKWCKVKKEILAKRFPISEMSRTNDGILVLESLDIYYYLATRLDYFGPEEDDQMIAVQIMEGLNEIYDEIGCLRFSRYLDQAKKLTLCELYMKDESTNALFEELNDLLKKKKLNFLMSDGLTATDVYFFCTMEFVKDMYPACLEPYPELANLIRRIGRDDVVKNFLLERKNKGIK